MNAILVLNLIAIGATSGCRKRAPAIVARECCMFVLNLVLNRFRERQCFVECLLAHLCVRSVDALVVSVSSALNPVLNRFRERQCLPVSVGMDPRWQHPFTCIVAGPTGCGKTTFVARLLRNASAMIDPPPERITWYYGEWQSAYENLDVPNMRLEEGRPTSFDTDGKRGLVVLDDLMAETDGRVTNLFTKKSHHSDTSVIYLVQNLFPKNKESRTISLNSQYMVVFKNPRDASQLANLARQMYPGRGVFVQEAFADATASPYGYLLIDLKQNTPDDLRLRTSILPDDAHQFVYVPKLCRKV